MQLQSFGILPRKSRKCSGFSWIDLARSPNVNSIPPDWFTAHFPRLLHGDSLDAATMTTAFRAILQGQVDDALTAAWLVALRMKGETGEEIAGAALALREQMRRLELRGRAVLDTCGTGGDESGTFNISTAAALVIAAAGVPVVKHGNRAVSSRSGSADVLRELGLPIESGPAWAQDCLDRLGFAFCYAPQFHPGMAHVARLRKLLGVRTIFNSLGPLANPAQAGFQLLGVGKPELMMPLAEALTRMNIRRAILVSSEDGLDEVSLGARTRLLRVEHGEIQPGCWLPSDFDLEPVALSDVRATTPRESAVMIERVLAGENSPARRLVLANAAAGLYVAGEVTTLREGVARADVAIRSNKAYQLLQQLRQQPDSA